MAFLPLTANWATEVRETLEYQTTITVANDGSEQRRSLRQRPRRTLAFDVLLAGDARREAVPFISRYQRAENRIPDPVAEAAFVLQTPATSSDTAVITHQPSWLVGGRYVAFIYKTQVSEYRVQTVNLSGDSATISFENAFGRTWPVGTKVLPSVTGYLRSSVDSTRRTADVATASIEFAVLPDGTESEVYDGLPAIAFGREMLAHRPNWTGDATETFVAESVDLDYGRGRIRRFTPNVNPGRSFVMDFVCRDREAVLKLTSLFRHARGRRGEFVMPTWTNDLVMSQDVPTGGSSLRTTNRRFGQAYSGDPVFASLVIVGQDGTLMPARILSAAADNTGTTVVLDRVFPTGLARAAVQQVCLAPVARFAADSLQITWRSSEVAVIRITCQTLKFLAPEDALLDDGAAYLISAYGWNFVKGTLVDPLQVIVNVTYPLATEHV